MQMLTTDNFFKQNTHTLLLHLETRGKLSFSICVTH